MNRRQWERGPAGLVVASVIQRVRVACGPCPWDGWESFLLDCGLRWTFVCIDDDVSGFLWGTLVCLRTGMSARQTAFAAWEEVGHSQLHAGSCDYWRQRPQGRLTVAKFERQARQFANWFPVWGEE